MWYYGNSAQQAGTAMTLCDQKPQKHTECCPATLRCAPATLTLSQNKLPQDTSIQSAWIPFDTSDQFSNWNAVVVEPTIGCSASFPHPGAEQLQQIRFCRDRLVMANGRVISSL
jgi:hypothetical protein